MKDEATVYNAKCIRDLFTLPLPLTKYQRLDHIRAILRLAIVQHDPHSGIPSDEEWASLDDAARLRWSPLRYAKLDAWWPLAHEISIECETEADFDQAFKYANALLDGVAYADDGICGIDSESYDSMEDAVVACLEDGYNGGVLNCGIELGEKRRARLIVLKAWDDDNEADYQTEKAELLAAVPTPAP